MDEKKDLKNEVIDTDGNVIEPTSTGQEEKKPKKEKAEPKAKADEDVDALPEWAKTKLETLERDKDNYKKGMLTAKKFSLTPEKKAKKEEEEELDLDDTSKKFQKQTVSKAEKVAEKKASNIVEDYNEKAAVAKFLESNPGLDEVWDDIVSNYTPKNGKETVESITKDLNRALLLTHYESGDLEKLKAEATRKGEKKGAAEAKVADMSSVSKTTGKVSSKGSTLTPGALKLADAMRVDKKELAKEDDSSTAEIKL